MFLVKVFTLIKSILGLILNKTKDGYKYHIENGGPLEMSHIQTLSNFNIQIPGAPNFKYSEFIDFPCYDIWNPFRIYIDTIKHEYRFQQITGQGD